MPKWFQSIRSLVAVLIVAVFCFVMIWLTVTAKLVLDGKDFTSIVTMIIVFYFAFKDRTQNPLPPEPPEPSK